MHYLPAYFNIGLALDTLWLSVLIFRTEASGKPGQKGMKKMRESICASSDIVERHGTTVLTLASSIDIRPRVGGKPFLHLFRPCIPDTYHLISSVRFMYFSRSRYCVRPLVALRPLQWRRRTK